MSVKIITGCVYQHYCVDKTVILFSDGVFYQAFITNLLLVVFSVGPQQQVLCNRTAESSGSFRREVSLHELPCRGGLVVNIPAECLIKPILIIC